MSKLNSEFYRPDVDGLRALAVIPVLLFHARLGCSGGFVGVDIFFVISGFLISTLILREISDGSFTLMGFWERRIRRILPALATVVVFTLVAGWCLFFPDDFKSLGASAVAQALLLSNVFFYHQAGYFAAMAETKPLLHTWSLAVEEQFYLLFPLLVLVLARRKVSLPKVFFGLALVSFVWSVLGTYSFPSATFYLLPTRAWELLMGAWLALMRGKLSVSSWFREMLGAVGFVLLCWSMYSYDKSTRFPGLAATAPCCGTALIILSSDSKLSWVGRVLAFKPFVLIGLISYSLYLWHWPLLVFATYLAVDQLSVWFRVAVLLSSGVVAAASWKYIETPFRRRRILCKHQQIFGFAACAMSIPIILGLLVYGSKGAPSRMPGAALAYAASQKQAVVRHNVSLEDALGGRFAEFGFRHTNRPVDLVLWGDSHAMSLRPAFEELCIRYSWRGIQATHLATAPVLEHVDTELFGLQGDAPVFAKAVLKFIAQNHVRVVVLSAYWPKYPATDLFKARLLNTVHSLLALGVRVYLVEDTPVFGFDVPRLAAFTAMRKGNVEELGITPERHEFRNREFRETFESAARMGATLLCPARRFINRRGLCAAVLDGKVLYYDGDHLTIDGSLLLIPVFEPIFQGAALGATPAPGSDPHQGP